MLIWIPVLTGKISPFTWDAHFYIRTPILIVKWENFNVCMGCPLSQQDAHIYCENGHPDAYIYVNIGIGMLIST